jgi:hypothetical protein
VEPLTNCRVTTSSATAALATIIAMPKPAVQVVALRPDIFRLCQNDISFSKSNRRTPAIWRRASYFRSRK